jgi:hypothetical protein
MTGRAALTAIAIATAVAVGAHPTTAATRCRGRHWVGVWATSPSDAQGGPFVDQSGPSIVDGRVLWGYGFTLFSGPGDGGVISFALGQ